MCGIRQVCSAGACTDLPSGNSYVAGTSPLGFISACQSAGTTLVLPSIDDAFVPVAFPFSFRFYGNATQTAWVSSNGVVGFGQAGPASAGYVNECSFGTMQRAIFAFWDDLFTRGGGVCYATVGSAPNRQFVVTWNDAYVLADPMTHLTFSVVLSEGSDVIDVLYATMSDAAHDPLGRAGISASIGLAADSAYTLDCCNSLSCVTSNTGRRYTPILR